MNVPDVIIIGSAFKDAFKYLCVNEYWFIVPCLDWTIPGKKEGSRNDFKEPAHPLNTNRQSKILNLYKLKKIRFLLIILQKRPYNSINYITNGLI